MKVYLGGFGMWKYNTSHAVLWPRYLVGSEVPSKHFPAHVFYGCFGLNDDVIKMRLKRYVFWPLDITSLRPFRNT